MGTFLIWLIFFIFLVAVVAGKSSGRKKRASKRNSMPRQEAYAPRQQEVRRTVTDADRAKLEAYRQKKAEAGAGQSVPNQDLNANRRRSAAQPNIVERAKANSKRYAGQDETLAEMEADHGHSERVAPAVAPHVEKEREKFVPEEGYLGTVEDLMVKGYDGSLSFERDFIGEAQEFLASITIPG